MNKVPKWVAVGVGTAVWLTVAGAGAAVAQNLGGIILPEQDAGVPAQEETISQDVLVPGVAGAQSVEEYATTGAGGVPDFITQNSYYTLGPDDVIEVTVLRHPEVSGEYIINNEGKIQFEFVGDVKVEGLKKDEVKDLLVKLLEEYIIAPEVTVKITGYNSKIVYVVGEVGRPGKIFMRGDTITVREALVQAGLPMLTAKTAKSHLITPSDDGAPEDRIVNVYKLLYEGDLRENLVMKPGDTLYIPPTFLAKTMRVIQPVTQPIREVGGTAGAAYGF